MSTGLKNSKMIPFMAGLMICFRPGYFKNHVQSQVFKWYSLFFRALNNTALIIIIELMAHISRAT
jgi:hypothetical protein